MTTQAATRPHRSDTLVHTVEETARLLKVSPTTIHKLIRQGQLGSVQIGVRRLVPDVDLLRFIEERRRANGLEEARDV